MKGWHFVAENKRLGYGDNRIVKPGITYKVEKTRPLKLCSYGLHASKRIIDALNYAPGPIVCRVELIGETLHDTDKAVAYERRVIAMIDATDILRKFARLCALDVVHLWNAPEIVVKYLKTGDESLRDAARVAARVAAWDAAGAAARDAAWDAARGAARGAAWDAARGAAWDAAWGAAGDAAWAAAEAAAGDKQNRRLTAMMTLLENS